MKAEHDDILQQTRTSLSKMAEIQKGYETLKPEIDKFNMLASVRSIDLVLYGDDPIRLCIVSCCVVSRRI